MQQKQALLMARAILHVQPWPRSDASISTISLSLSQEGHRHQSQRDGRKKTLSARAQLDRYCGETTDRMGVHDEQLMELHKKLIRLYEPDKLQSEQAFIEQYYREDNCLTIPIACAHLLDDVWKVVFCQTLMEEPSPDLGSAGKAECEKIKGTLREIMEEARQKVEKRNDICSDVLMKIGAELVSNRSYLRSVMCYFAVSTTLTSRNTNNKSCELSTCVYHIFQASKDMKKDLQVATFLNIMEHIFPLVWEVVSNFGNVQGSISSENDVDFEHGVSLFYVARMYNSCELYEEDATINERAIKKLQRSRESSRFFACCYNNAGVAHTKLKNYAKARLFYKQAIDSYKLVTNWTCAMKRDDSIATTARNLKKVENLLKGQ